MKAYVCDKKSLCGFFFYQEEVSFVLAVGDVFHVEGNDVFCMAS